MSIIDGAMRLVMLMVIVMAVSTCGSSGVVEQHGLRVSEAWSPEASPGARVLAGFLTIENTNAATARLMSAHSDAAQSVEIHSMSMDQGIMRMRPVTDGLEIGAGSKLVLAPSGFHLMIMSPSKPFKAGDMIPVMLHFDGERTMNLVLQVKGRGA